MGCLSISVHLFPRWSWGLASMSVKDVLQGLVDDALVDSDRVGTSNYFWAFPSKVANSVS